MCGILSHNRPLFQGCYTCLLAAALHATCVITGLASAFACVQMVHCQLSLCGMFVFSLFHKGYCWLSSRLAVSTHVNVRRHGIFGPACTLLPSAGTVGLFTEQMGRLIPVLM